MLFSKSTVRWAIAGGLWLAFLGFGSFWLFGPHTNTHQIRPSGYHEKMSQLTAGSLGGDRRAALVAATRHYLAEHPEAPAAMQAGKAFAPADFLNEELARHGAKWRVRSVKGLDAHIYEVS